MKIIEKIKIKENLDLVYSNDSVDSGTHEFIDICDSKHRIILLKKTIENDKSFKVKYIGDEIFSDELKFEFTFPTPKGNSLPCGVNKRYVRLRVMS